MPSVTVTGKVAPVLEAEQAQVSGWTASLAQTPASVSVLGADLLTATATDSLAAAIRLDASLADQYNTTGYIESMAVRGFVLDQLGNYRRNGLATFNDAPFAPEALERIEVLHGVAGLQAGVSAPGGLVNFVTKTPQSAPFQTLMLGLNEHGGARWHLDFNRTQGALGLRVNVVDEALRPGIPSADGRRQLLAVAASAALSSNTTLEANLQTQHKRQPSVPGLGLLDTDGNGVGETLPTRIDARLNLNNQPWSQPFDIRSTVAELALNHRLNANWQARFAVNTQRLHIDDRLAFPDGCSSAPTYVYPGLCANGDVDVYDYRSEGERRALWSWEARLDGRFQALGAAHDTRLGLSAHSVHADPAPMQAYNWVGVTNIDAPVVLPADPTLTSLNTLSHERALAAYATLHSHWGAGLESFVGLRSTRIRQGSARSDGSRAVALDQTVSTPWAGLSAALRPNVQGYVSFGQGVEVEAVPNRSDRFANAGQALAAHVSRQRELGLKWQADRRLLLSAAVFQVDQPQADDQPAADPAGLPTRVAGARLARHRGLELTATGRVTPALSVQASLMALDARYTQALEASRVGQRVTNVPRLKAAWFADYKFAALPGLSANMLASYERGKAVMPDGASELPATWQIDTGLAYVQHRTHQTLTWRVNVENLTDRRAWREAPTADWGGVYLFPSTPRTVRLSVAVDF
ncbi:MAG: TonB-dependent receptor [Rhodoferax sp.]